MKIIKGTVVLWVVVSRHRVAQQSRKTRLWREGGRVYLRGRQKRLSKLEKVFDDGHDDDDVTITI